MQVEVEPEQGGESKVEGEQGRTSHKRRRQDVEGSVLKHMLTGHMSPIYSLAFDGLRVVSGGLDTTVRVWDVESG